MATLIKQLSNGSIVEFDSGSFDEWCVYLTTSNKQRNAPRDITYFTILKSLGQKHGCKRVYNDFVSIYQLTNKSVSSAVLELITQISHGYLDDSEEIETWFTVLYAGMVAEENKEKAVLRKRIKRLGMHQLLMDGHTPEFAANFSKGKKWRELDAIMREKGF